MAPFGRVSHDSSSPETESGHFYVAGPGPDATPRAGRAWGRPDAENLVTIYAALSGRESASILTEFGGGQFSTFKNALVELAVEKLSPIGAEMRRLTADPAMIDAVLADGSARARAIAEPVMRDGATSSASSSGETGLRMGLPFGTMPGLRW